MESTLQSREKARLQLKALACQQGKQSRLPFKISTWRAIEKLQAMVQGAHVQILKSCLNEQNLELLVKKANEAKVISQQRLVATKAEIADLRQKLEASKRNMLFDTFEVKNKEKEAYLAELESIGQAYDHM
ncbi:hypothetical protein J1N35_025799 [Gossypium stocksii]|uniref:E3 ubiquitin protein ligase n=1 Tax=Gossypium stocksii TaxID=47602 RepID=A0A9D3ZY16_9ROSI|nr:hypothetical protein J1N35_025799 [Gossypium stocksii]